MVARKALIFGSIAAALSFLASVSFALAQSQPIDGLIAKRETDLLSYEDKLAAYDAEQAVLSNKWGTQGYHWKGPNGAYGTIITGASIPEAESRKICRRFIHIVHHANDGGANPTFQGTICLNGDGQWEPKGDPNTQKRGMLNPVLIEAGGEKLPDVDRRLALETEQRVLIKRFPGGEGYNWYGPSGAKGNVRTVYVWGESDDCRTLRHQITHANGETVVAEGQLCLSRDGNWLRREANSAVSR